MTHLESASTAQPFSIFENHRTSFLPPPSSPPIPKQNPAIVKSDEYSAVDAAVSHDRTSEIPIDNSHATEEIITHPAAKPSSLRGGSF